MQIKINEAAKLTGVTVRTLHYYDQIGLLRPETVTDTGYRLYGEKDLERLPRSFSSGSWILPWHRLRICWIPLPLTGRRRCGRSMNF